MDLHRCGSVSHQPNFLHVTSRVRNRSMQDHGLVMNGPDVHIVRKIGEGQDRPHGELPLDISLGKVVEFLVGRQKLPRDWHQRVSAIQARTADCYKQLPQALSKQLAGDAPLDYFKAVERCTWGRQRSRLSKMLTMSSPTSANRAHG
ncbi:hypothetical protein V8C86DRAFT_1183108 [Haematococcus lacustris]